MFTKRSYCDKCKTWFDLPEGLFCPVCISDRHDIQGFTDKEGKCCVCDAITEPMQLCRECNPMLEVK